MIQPGRFITVEGPDGAGKTTNLSTVQSLLEEAGRQVLRTREPGGTALGEQVRDVVLNHRSSEIDPMTETLLIFAARCQHVQTVIKPALRRGVWVLSDRFTDATYAYQGGGRNVDTEFIGLLERAIQGDLQPDLTLLLDLDAAVSDARLDPNQERDRFEGEQADFKRAVRQTYIQRAGDFPDRIKTIDASRSVVEVRKQVEQVIHEFLSNC